MLERVKVLWRSKMYLAWSHFEDSIHTEGANRLPQVTPAHHIPASAPKSDAVGVKVTPTRCFILRLIAQIDPLIALGGTTHQQHNLRGRRGSISLRTEPNRLAHSTRTAFQFDWHDIFELGTGALNCKTL